MRVTVRAPATVANLGPGFDCLALALDLANVFTVDTEAMAAVGVEGEGAGVSVGRRLAGGGPRTQPRPAAGRTDPRGGAPPHRRRPASPAQVGPVRRRRLQRRPDRPGRPRADRAPGVASGGHGRSPPPG